MAQRREIEKAMKSALIGAFTFAAALIWKDFFTELIEQFVPQGDAIYYQLLAAGVATVIIIIAIYVVMKTEYEAEHLFRKMSAKKRRKKK